MAGITAARHAYHRAVDTAAGLWEATQAGEIPDVTAASSIVTALAALIASDPVALIAMTASPDRCHPGDRNHLGRETFTHMVNVSALTMAQAAALNLDGPLLHAFGMAALMHDIGKVRTPPDVLHKPGKLTPEETAIIQRHVFDGAAILRRTPGMTPLAPVVALEHHMREGPSGYPQHIGSQTLNVCTLMVSIADVFDALRSDRPYRQGLAAARVRVIMNEPGRLAFNQPLLTRFIELIADTCEPDDRGTHPRTVTAAIDPDALGIDPLAYL